MHIIYLAFGSITFLLMTCEDQSYGQGMLPNFMSIVVGEQKIFHYRKKKMREIYGNNLCNYRIFLKTLLQCVLNIRILTHSQNCQEVKNDGKRSDWKLIIAKNLEVVYWCALRKM